MKVKNRFIHMMVIFILPLAAMVSCNTETETKKVATPEELSQMNKDFAKALNNKDAEAASILYAEDASLLPPNEQIVAGRENIKKY